MYPERARFVRFLSPVAAAAVLIGVAGCGSDDTEPTRSPGSASDGCAAQSTSGAAGVKLMPVPPAKITVIEAGTEPRQLAGATPDRSTPQSSTLVTTSTVASAGDTESRTVEMPLTSRFHCSDATDLELTLGTVTAPDPVLGEQLRAVSGSRAGLAIGPGNALISLRLLPNEKSGSDARMAVEQSLLQALQMSVPMPTEPIGVGARWRVERILNSAATVTQHLDVTLRSRTGNRLTLDVTAEETPVNSTFAIPGSDQTLNISRFSNSGHGELTVDLGRALPVSGTITMSGARELVGSDAARTLVQQTGLTVSWRDR